MDVLALEPWLGGSHRRFLEQWRARSRHAIEIVGLAPRHWKWRMSAGHWQLARRLARAGRRRPDALVVSDYVDLPGLYGLLPPSWASVPSVLYLHENQLTYPAAASVESPARAAAPGPASAAGREPVPDRSFGFVNLLSCVRAGAVAFNSRFHREELRAAARDLLAVLPRPSPRAEVAAALDAAEVVPPGIDLDEVALGPGPAPGRDPAAGAPLRVAFNHRWEHDKDPETFLRAVLAARAAGARLELVLLGETFERAPAGCAPLLAALEDDGAVARRGFAASRAEYVAELGHADLVVSTARHEFYGMAVLEALAAGCHPLLPRALAYPEVVPVERHAAALWDTPAELARRLVELAAEPGTLRSASARSGWRAVAAAHDARTTAALLDGLCERAARRRPPAAEARGDVEPLLP